jgi:hypothetical protein
MISNEELVPLAGEKCKGLLAKAEEAQQSEQQQQQQQPGQQTPGKKSTPNWAYFVFALLALVALGYMMSVQISHDQKARLLKPAQFWEDLMVAKVMHPDRCVTNGTENSLEFLNGPVGHEFKEFIDYINADRQLDYFLCFSTLFYTMKVEGFEKLTIKKNIDKIMAFEDKCSLWSHSKEDTVPSVAHVHLCTLKHNHTRSIVQIVRDFVKYYDENTPFYSKIKLLFNKFNGEYQVVFAENLKVTFHEYERKYKLATDKFYDATSILDHLRAAESLDKNKDFKVEEKVTLNTGIIKRVFGYDGAFSMPYEFFNQRPEMSYVKYLNTVIKLPNRLNDYLAYFYPQFYN